ncbi:MAG TPA: TrmH family RNA methyltransferase [Candidatus Paceibacterota bacterium]
MSVFLILYNIRSAENVGAIFRTADAVGINKIYLVGYTPAPKDRFGRLRQDIAKAALGAEKTVSWEQVNEPQLSNLVAKLKAEGVEVVALEQSEDSLDYKEYKPKTDFALVMGNEVGGVPVEVLNQCDKVIEIPMRGSKESLNVSVAVGVALYRLLDRD